MAPHTRRVTCPAWYPCLLGADCLRSDVMTNSRGSGASDLDLRAKPYCQCKHKQGYVAQGPGALNDFKFGPYPAQSGYSLYPATCAIGTKRTDCRCVRK